MNIDDIFLWYSKRSFIFSHNFNYQFILVQHFHSSGSVDLRWPIAILVVCCCVSLIVSVHAITNTYLLLGIRESVVWVGLHLIRIMKLQYINFNLLQVSSPKHLHVHDYSFAGQECLYQNIILHNLLFSCDCKGLWASYYWRTCYVLVFKTVSFFSEKNLFPF